MLTASTDRAPAAAARESTTAGAPPTPLTAEAAAWIRDEVIGSYHWAVWRTDWRDSAPANERNVECEPGYVPETPYPVEVCFHRQPVCTLVGPGRGGEDRSWRGYRVWLSQIPAASSPPFTAERAESIREHAWTAAMRKTYAEVPGFYTTCPCEWDLTAWCRNGQCDRCHRATPLRAYETLIGSRRGNHPASFPEPYAHQTDVSATGPDYESLAMVWLADRVCRWVCTCACHDAPPSSPPAEPVQLDLDLFAEVV